MQRIEYDIVARLLGELGNLDCSTSELAAVLAALVEHSPIPLWIFDRGHYIVYNNRASCRFGTGNSVIGRHADAFTSDIRGLLRQGLQGCQETAVVCSREGWIMSPVIGERYLRFDFLPLPNGLIASLCHDLTENMRVMEALKASEERAMFFAEMLERALVPFSAASPDGRLFTANHAFCELTGYSEEELHGLSLFRELTSDSTKAAELAALQELRQSGLPQRYEKEIPRRDGSTVPVEMFVQQVNDDQGNLRQISAFVTDISDRKRAEEVQQQTLAVLDAVLQHTSIMMIYLDPEFNFIWVNRAYAETCQHDPAYFPGKNHFELYPNAEYQAIFQRVVDTGESCFMPAQALTFGTHPESGVTYWDWSIIAVQDASARTIGLVFSMAEATERIAADRALRESEERFRLVTELTTDGIWDWHIGSEYEYLSPMFKRMLGYADDELPDRSDIWELLIHPDDLEMAHQAFVEHVEQDKPMLFSARYKHKNGSYIWVSCRGQALKDEQGKYYRVVGTHTDITARKLAEEQLAEAHEFSQKIISASSVGIAANKASGQCVLVNDAAAQVIGAAKGEILKQNFRQLESWRKSGLLAAADRALESGATQSGEFHLVTSFGKEVWWDCSLTPFVSNGEPHLLTVIMDTSERKRAEDALRQSEEFLQAVVSTSPLGVSVRDRTGKLLSYNAAWQRIWLVSDDYVAADMRKDRKQLVFDESDAYCKPWWAEIKRVFDEGGTVFIGEACTNPDSQGAAVWVSQHFYGILDKQGAVDRVVIITQDITERKRTEEALRESEERLALALEGAADGIWDFYPASGYTYRSPHLALQLGYGADNLAPTAEAWLELVHPDDLERVQEAWQAHLEGRCEQYASEHRLRKADGDYIWVLDCGKVVQRDELGRPLRVTGTHKNITERKAVEERLMREQREQTLIALASGIAHDFNNILVGILGGVSLLQESMPASDQRLELCSLIDTSARRMTDLTSKLLAYARGGAFSPQAVDVGLAVQEAISMTRATIPSHISVESQLTDALWAVQADPSQLSQVLLNLLINAREAIGDARGRIIFMAENVSMAAAWQDGRGADHPAGTYVSIRVSDSGCGMDADTQRRIFEPFFSSKRRGRGLGLSAVSGIVQMHGGAIKVESQPGQGSTFEVLLPVTATALVPEAEAELQLPTGTETVLIVDDDDIVLATARAMLQHLGYTVHAAGSSARALEIFRARGEHVDLAIIDLQMPQISGPHLLDLLRQTQPNMKAVISSGFSKDHALESITLDDSTMFIQKPYRVSDLASMVRKIIDGSFPQSSKLGYHWIDML